MQLDEDQSESGELASRKNLRKRNVINYNEDKSFQAAAKQ
jgi:hypothetical protein